MHLRGRIIIEQTVVPLVPYIQQFPQGICLVLPLCSWSGPGHQTSLDCFRPQKYSPALYLDGLDRACAGKTMKLGVALPPVHIQIFSLSHAQRFRLFRTLPQVLGCHDGLRCWHHTSLTTRFSAIARPSPSNFSSRSPDSQYSMTMYIHLPSWKAPKNPTTLGTLARTGHDHYPRHWD